MNHELAKTLTTALVQFIDKERPKGSLCCSSYECEKIEKAFEGGTYDVVENLIKRKLTGLTEFELFLFNAVLDNNFVGAKGSENAFEMVKKIAPELLALAKKELLSYADESNPAIEAMADLERAFTCGNDEHIPRWLKDELAKKHLDGYCMGREDTMREMKDFLESHFNTKKAKEEETLTDLYYKEYEGNPTPIPTSRPLCFEAGGTCTNPQMDCINCPRKTTGGMFNTSSGTSTLKAEG